MTTSFLRLAGVDRGRSADETEATPDWFRGFAALQCVVRLRLTRNPFLRHTPPAPRRLASTPIAKAAAEPQEDMRLFPVRPSLTALGAASRKGKRTVKELEDYTAPNQLLGCTYFNLKSLLTIRAGLVDASPKFPCQEVKRPCLE